MSSDTAPPKPWFSLGLSFVGGYGDAAGFIVAKAFTGHVTGSLVLAAIAMAGRDWRGTLARLSAVVCFLAGVLFSVLIARTLASKPTWQLLPTAMGIEVVLIVAAYGALASHLAPGVEIFVVCLSLGLGLQNGAFRRTGGISVHTTYLTGMITRLITAEAEKYVFEAAPAMGAAVRLLCGIWFTFLLGALTGAAMVFRFKELGIIGAAVILLVMIAFHSRMRLEQ